MNSGQPMMALTTPTGSPYSPDTLAMQFATRRKNPPNTAEAGSRCLASDPTNSLAMWG